MFSKEATEIDEIFTVNFKLFSKRQIDCEDFVICHGLLRKYELYDSFLSLVKAFMIGLPTF